MFDPAVWRTIINIHMEISLFEIGNVNKSWQSLLVNVRHLVDSEETG